VAWDTVTILSSWTDNLLSIPWETALQPTLSRGRTIRNLTVNTFHPFELLPAAFETGRFEWYPERDDEREQSINDSTQMHEYASSILAGWELFLYEHSAVLGEPGHAVSGPRGDLTYAALLESQRWHAAWHHRQVNDHCRRQGLDTLSQLPASLVEDVDLPDYIY
jgi:hypothetical protein